MTKTKKPKQPKAQINQCTPAPASEYDRFETTLKRLLAVPKSEIDAQIKQEKRGR